jgi:hypothetical protein
VVCSSTHAFRAPRGDVDDEVLEPISVRRRQEVRTIPWAAVFEEFGPVPVKPYSPRNTYNPNDVIDHPVFGEGYVSHLVSDTKLEAVFKDGPRMLAFKRVDLPPATVEPKKNRPKLPRPAPRSVKRVEVKVAGKAVAKGISKGATAKFPKVLGTLEANHRAPAKKMATPTSVAKAASKESVKEARPAKGKESPSVKAKMKAPKKSASASGARKGAIPQSAVRRSGARKKSAPPKKAKKQTKKKQATKKQAAKKQPRRRSKRR